MFLLKTNFRNKLIILFMITIITGSVLVWSGGYITDNYFSNMVSGLIGDSGEYDLLLTLGSDKEDMALEQIEQVIEGSLEGAEMDSGPKVAGSSNYLLKLPDKYKNEEVYSDIDDMFDNIPGVMSTTIMTEPRLSVRGFRGGSRSVIKDRINGLEGIDFMYNAGDGFDIILTEPEHLPKVKTTVDNTIDEYSLFELRYPLDQEVDNLDEIKTEVMTLVEDDFEVKEIKDVSDNGESDREVLLKNLKQMKTFLLSYATKINLNEFENSEDIAEGSELIIPGEKEDIILRVVDNQNDKVSSLVQKGTIEEVENREIYLRNQDGSTGEYLGEGTVSNPREDLSEALEHLNEITPRLNSFMDQSEELVEYSNMLDEDLVEINDNMGKLTGTGERLNNTLDEWQEQELSRFLRELTEVLDEIEGNAGDINQVQEQIILTSNQMKEAAGIISEKMVYVPRNNDLYDDLEELKNLFLDVSGTMDDNYEGVTERMDNMDPLLTSIDDWKEKIDSLLKVEDTLNEGAGWEEVETIVEDINNTAEIIDTADLQEQLVSIQELLEEVQTTQLPRVLDQLDYIQESLPDLEDDEITETINLIDEYMAGEVIPGDQIQLMIRGNYNENMLKQEVNDLVKNPAVSLFNMEAGMIQPNPRGEVFNVLRQVRSVISILLAFIFTLLVMILDQTLIVSILKLHGKRGYIYSFLSGSIILGSIYYLSQINFPYLNLQIVFIMGGILGVIVCLFSDMLNPVSREEWEAGKALGFSPGEIMQEIVIPSSKPGFLYLLNKSRVIFK